MSGDAEQTYVLGVDGGGTKSIAIIADVRGIVLGAGRAGNCDIYNNDRAVDEVERAVLQACAEADIDRLQIGAAVYSLAGCDWPEDFVHWQTRLKARSLGQIICVVNDAVGALSSDVPEGNALFIICGTGAATGSRNAKGDVWHSSFWQLTQGGHELSQKVLEAVYRGELGIDPPTTLAPRVLAYFSMTSVEQLLHTFTGREQQKPSYMAGLVPLLFDEAEAGDGAALRIIEHHADALAEVAIAAARKVNIVGQPINLLLTGGVFRNPSPLMRDRIIEKLHQAMPQITVIASRSEPIKGAVTIALQAQGIKVTPEVEAALAATLPRPEFFHTHI